MSVSDNSPTIVSDSSAGGRTASWGGTTVLGKLALGFPGGKAQQRSFSLPWAVGMGSSIQAVYLHFLLTTVA